MKRKSYTVIKKLLDTNDFFKKDIWITISPLFIDKYMWINNGYTPRVQVKLFHTDKYIYLYYKVTEDKIKIKYITFGSDVYKDSCVEFFINPFPKYSDEYFNMEFNALGVALIGVGKDGDDTKRYYFKKNEIKELKIISSIKKPMSGYHGAKFWELFIKVPKRIFGNFYSKEFIIKECMANFYKCGDETEFEHYGAWNKIVNPTPDFSITKYFGKLIFEES
jgi:hypothetical protein